MNDRADRCGDDRAARLPVIGGGRWFDTDGRPFVLSIECPLAFEEMVAALYGAAEAGDLAGDEDLCGAVAVVLLIEGLAALKDRAAWIRRDEQRGAIESPAFLALCRHRVAALIRP